eukprot:Tbor_TRINITY_DN5484_c0_g1::TRINITY_DN5484_c0_g1_i1::g.25021::m.25021
MSLCHIIGGMIFSVSIFIFFDGYVTSKRVGTPPHTYQFPDFLPLILSVTATLITSFIDPNHLINGADEESMHILGDGADKGEVRSKMLLLVSAVLMMSAMSLAVWRQVEPYSAKGMPIWAGSALILQPVFMTMSAVICAFGRKKKDVDDLIFY